MLILIAGATGNIGQHLVASALERGHIVRALGRNADKLPSSLSSRLESFIRSSSHTDIPALDRACASVDAIVVAYSGLTELQVDGQLMLLRAAERAGVKKFVSASWNYDWRNMQLGQQESYDGLIAFRRVAELTSSIKPVYIFSGVLAEVLFSVEGHGDFSPKNHGVWDPVAKKMVCYGSGDETWHWTTEGDAAEMTIEILQTDEVEKGGFWTAYSGEMSLTEIAEVYERIRGVRVTVEIAGSIDELRRIALEARAKGDPQQPWNYIGYFYQLYTVDRTWTLGKGDFARLPGFKPTTLEEFLARNPGV